MTAPDTETEPDVLVTGNEQADTVRVGALFGSDDDSDTVSVLVYGDRAMLASLQGQLVELHPVAVPANKADAQAEYEFLASIASDCKCCASCASVPCGGCQQGAPCDSTPCECDSDWL